MRQPKETSEAKERNLRILSVAAGTFIALSCGTNYAFSAWAPQFTERLHLTATEINLIGNFGNIGMYAMGIPGGLLIDRQGPRWGVLMGSICLAFGYFPLHSAYKAGPGNVNIPALCFFSLLTGVGSCTAFSASLKVCATNWPRHRGTATGLPLGAFGLSAFFYTALASIFFPNNAEGYLRLLGAGTTVMTFAGMFFLETVPQSGSGLSRKDERSPTRPTSGRNISASSSTRLHDPFHAHERVHSAKVQTEYADDGDDETDEQASLVGGAASGQSTPGPGDIDNDSVLSQRRRSHVSFLPHATPDISGWALLRSAKFWQLFLMLSLLAGVGLMTINNIGNNARSLWRHFDPSRDAKFIQSRQMLHVSILSLCSFGGRLASGIGSDFLLHRGLSRGWTLVASSAVFLVAQLVALHISNPNFLFLLSGLSGLGYGVLFGVYPALVADAFGPSGMGINWGCITWAPVLSANAFNLIYGSILDRHSEFDGDTHERSCSQGLACYRNAYWITLAASLCAVGWSLWCVGRESVQMKRERERWERREHDP